MSMRRADEKRMELGLPLVSQPTLTDEPAERICGRRAQDAYVQAARGGSSELFLADGGSVTGVALLSRGRQ